MADPIIEVSPLILFELYAKQRASRMSWVAAPLIGKLTASDVPSAWAGLLSKDTSVDLGVFLFSVGCLKPNLRPFWLGTVEASKPGILPLFQSVVAGRLGGLLSKHFVLLRTRPGRPLAD